MPQLGSSFNTHSAGPGSRVGQGATRACPSSEGHGGVATLEDHSDAKTCAVQVEVAVLQLQEELEGKGLSRAIVDGLLADRRAALTAEVEAHMAAKPGTRCCCIWGSEVKLMHGNSDNQIACVPANKADEASGPRWGAAHWLACGRCTSTSDHPNATMILQALRFSRLVGVVTVPASITRCCKCAQDEERKKKANQNKKYQADVPVPQSNMCCVSSTSCIVCRVVSSAATGSGTSDGHGCDRQPCGKQRC